MGISFFRNLAIREKLIALVLIPLGAVLLLVGLAFLIYEGSSTRVEIVRGLNIRTQILSANLTAAVMFDDVAAAEEVLLGLKVDPHIIGAWILTKNKGLFAQYTRNSAHPNNVTSLNPQLGHRFENNSLIITHPIYAGDKQLGTISLRSDLGLLHERIRLAVIISGASLLLALLIGALISFKIQRMLSEPITDLVILTQQVSKGKNYSLRTAWPHGRDELGQLAEALNHMLSQIEMQNEQLKNVNLALEEGIRERTSEILKTEKFLDLIIENIPHMIFIKEAKQLRFTLLNRAGEELLGVLRQDVIGKNDYDFFPKKEADFFTAKDYEVLKGGHKIEISEEPISTKSGVRLLRTKKVPLTDEHGQPQHLLGISEDITQVKQAQVDILQKTEQLARSQMEIEQLELFAFAATHDLQEPLRAIIFYADLLKTQILEQLSEEERSNLNRIQSAAERMRNMMEQMRDLSRIRTTEGLFKEVDLNQVLQDALKGLELTIREAGAQVEIDRLPIILGDQTQMLLLFQNLFSNAIKFHKKGAEPAFVRVQARVLEGDSLAEITVQDNGIGFEEKYLDRIFKPFQRLHGIKEFGGTGLGLAICRKIVLRHSGTITAKSVLGEGSKFIVTLPIYHDKIQAMGDLNGSGQL